MNHKTGEEYLNKIGLFQNYRSQHSHIADDAIQILPEKKLEDGNYKVKYREEIPVLEKIKGCLRIFSTAALSATVLNFISAPPTSP